MADDQIKPMKQHIATIMTGALASFESEDDPPHPRSA
jgi:hypothetical protein